MNLFNLNDIVAWRLPSEYRAGNFKVVSCLQTSSGTYFYYCEQDGIDGGRARLFSGETWIFGGNYQGRDIYVAEEEDIILIRRAMLYNNNQQLFSK